MDCFLLIRSFVWRLTRHCVARRLVGFPDGTSWSAGGSRIAARALAILGYAWPGYCRLFDGQVVGVQGRVEQYDGSDTTRHVGHLAGASDRPDAVPVALHPIFGILQRQVGRPSCVRFKPFNLDFCGVLPLMDKLCMTFFAHALRLRKSSVHRAGSGR